MNKQEIIELVIEEILKGVSTRIREIVREEVDIERKRIRKQLLEEFRGEERRTPTKEHITQPAARTDLFPKKKVKIDTGDREINSILESIQTDMIDMAPEMKFEPETTFEDASQQRVTETKKIQESTKTGLYRPPQGEAYNFDPATMDPSQMDWTPMVDALENQTALPGDRK